MWKGSGRPSVNREVGRTGEKAISILESMKIVSISIDKCDVVDI